MKPFNEQNYYEVLEIPPDAGPLDIRRAYKANFSLYQDDSLASYSFFSEEERTEILSCIEQAYLTLINPEARKAYDQSLILAGLLDAAGTFRDRTKEPIAIYEFQAAGRNGSSLAKRSAELKQRIAQTPAIRRLLSQDTLAGSDLREIRTVLEVPLEEIAERTNIRIDTLQAIEAEQVECFPPLVYLKGFLRAYSRCLELDAGPVMDGYLRKLGFL